MNETNNKLSFFSKDNILEDMMSCSQKKSGIGLGLFDSSVKYSTF